VLVDEYQHINVERCDAVDIPHMLMLYMRGSMGVTGTKHIPGIYAVDVYVDHTDGVDTLRFDNFVGISANLVSD